MTAGSSNRSTTTPVGPNSALTNRGRSNVPPLAIAENAAASQAAANAAAKVKAAVGKKAAADKAVAEAKQKSRELAEQQAKTLPGYKSSVWSVSFSPDGKLIATGSHKDSIKIWNVADATELFPQPEDESSSDASNESGEGETS